MLPVVITTEDGSHSLLNETLNETYHSRHGAIQESRHVFLAQGLEFLVQERKPRSVSILEIGFGTGLNALLTLTRTFQIDMQVHYMALETDPLNESIWSTLNYGQVLQVSRQFVALHRCGWGTPQTLDGKFQLLKQNTSLQEISLAPMSYDLVYYDAFAPSKQPELWTRSILEKVVDAMAMGGVLVTYCAKGQLKRDLKNLGLFVETLPGPPGKKEMTRGTKSGGVVSS
jgi:tRNA U34 5-methylaminomethyl-2-thiouridine-forming methyltransferase MnmC